MFQIEDEETDEIKVILIGDSGVGKTNLINIAMGNEFNDNEKTTSTATFSVKKMKINGKEYNLIYGIPLVKKNLGSLQKFFLIIQK